MSERYPGGIISKTAPTLLLLVVAAELMVAAVAAVVVVVVVDVMAPVAQYVLSGLADHAVLHPSHRLM